jgi:hypothetical protein
MGIHSLQYTYARGQLGDKRLRSLHGLLATAILDGWGGLAHDLPGPSARPARDRHSPGRVGSQRSVAK